MPDVMPLPVAGYRPQSQAHIDLVNSFKEAEERLLRILDNLQPRKDIDQRWLAIGRTDIERAFMAITRAVFQPKRVELED